jgi:antitoxin MazE
MNQHVKKWGNSAAVRLPAATLAAAGLKVDDPIDIREEDGRIVIEGKKKPVRKVVSLKELLSRVTDENIHPETDWGPPVGREVW